MLTQAHVRALRDNPSTTVRADVAAAIGTELSSAALSEREIAIAAEILEVLAQDAERRVREALAEHVKECPFLPREIALALARDLEDQVAVPILEHSPVLTEADLILHVEVGITARQLAVARRRTLPEPVADALVATQHPDVVGTVLRNAGAELSERALLRVVETFAGDEAIETLVIDRPTLTLAVCEALIVRVSAALRQRLVGTHNLPEFLADELAQHGRERSVAVLLAEHENGSAWRLATHLHAKERLNATLILRSLCLGDLSFFDAAMAVRAGIPVASARTLLYDRGPGGLRGLYTNASLPPELFRAFRAAVSAVLDGRLKLGVAAFTSHILGELVVLYEDLSPTTLEQALAQLARRVPVELR